MTAHPGLLPAILIATLALLATLRRRRDAVAGLCLIASVAAGIVPARLAFSGFAQPVVPTLACLLVLGGAARDGGLFERLLLPARRLPGRIARRLVLAAAGVAGGFLGRTAASQAMQQSADQLARRSPDEAIRPGRLGYAAALGGLATLIGTVPNLLVSLLREAGAGSPHPANGAAASAHPAGFGLFAYAPAGIGMAAIGLALLAWRSNRARPGEHLAAPASGGRAYVSEMMLPAGSELVGLTIRALRARALQAGVQESGGFAVLAVVRETYRRMAPRPALVLEASDLLVIATGPDVLQRLLERRGLRIAGAALDGASTDGASIVEAVVSPGSELVGRSPGEVSLEQRFGIGLVAIGRPGEHVETLPPNAAPNAAPDATPNATLASVAPRAPNAATQNASATSSPPAVTHAADPQHGASTHNATPEHGLERSLGVRLRRAKLRAGDLLVLHGDSERIGAALASLGCRQLNERRLQLGRSRLAPVPLLLLALALVLAWLVQRALALAGAPVLDFPGGALLALALIAAVGVLIAVGIVTAEAAYGAVAWPLLVTLACLLPVSAAFASGPQVQVAAAWLARAAPSLPDAALMEVALLVGLLGTRGVGSAATVLLAGPLALAWANRLGLPVDPVLLALALGASVGLVRARSEPALELGLSLALALAGVPLLRLGASL